jgi:hypothetical protein
MHAQVVHPGAQQGHCHQEKEQGFKQEKNDAHAVQIRLGIRWKSEVVEAEV